MSAAAPHNRTVIPRLRTLTQQFGALYAFVLALVVIVCAIAVVQLRTIQLDASRLMEESREQVVASRLTTSIQSLQSLVAQPTTIDPTELERGRRLLADSYAGLEALERSDDDPSDESHQGTETRIGEALAAELAEIDRYTEARTDPEWRKGALQSLERARQLTDVFLAEAHSEADESNADLQARVRSTTTTLWITTFSALTLLGFALTLVHKRVVKPLKHMRAVSERFGLGEDTVRMHVEETPEIGGLATTFNAMADRLSGAKADLEERVRQRTSEFLRAARMVDLGILASGIAHEINTPLASISSCAEGLRRRLRSGDLPPELLEEYSTLIADETLRARDITTRMLSLVRHESSEVTSISLADVVDQSRSALQHRAQVAGVRLESQPVSADVLIDVNPGELVQVLVNLIANACDASERGGRVLISARVVDGELLVEVRDEGSGIAPEELERVFEPFYTTKAAQHGTGLGLALVSTLVQHRGGRVSVTSDVGVGTTFHVVLPAHWSAAA